MLIVAISISLGCLFAACGGGGEGAPSVTNLESITIDPVNSSIAVGTKVQLHATGAYKNKTTKDVTDSVTWESANTKVAKVSNATDTKGLADGSGVGGTSVSAKLQGVKGVSAFTVTNASLKSITVEPVNPLVAKGTAVQLAAQGNFSDGSVQDLTTQVSWSSGNSAIASVSNSSSTIALVTGVSVGNTPITATFKGTQGSTTVRVTGANLTSITITDPSIAKGSTVQLTATCNFSDGTTQDCTREVGWTSGDSGIAQVSHTAPTNGLVTGVGVGNTTITGTFGGTQGSANVSVTSATLTSITITPPSGSVAKGTILQLTATGNFTDGTTQDLTTQVAWTSGNNAIEQVSGVPGTKGVVTGLVAGSTAITATLNGVAGSTTLRVTAATLASLTITPPDTSIAKGTAVQLTATGNFGDGTTQDLTTQASWTSGNNTIAQVSGALGTKGLVTGLGAGSAVITVTFEGVQGSTTLSVTSATLTSLTITPPDPSIAKATAVQLTATGNFGDGTTQDLTSQASWTSGNEKIAQVSDEPGTKGLVTGLGVGSTAITVTLNGVHGSTTLSVTGATLTSLTITPTDTSLAKGTSEQLTATGAFSDGTTEDLTTTVSWTSSALGTATVSNAGGSRGLVTGTGVGTATITATQGGISGTATVTVTAATLDSIAVFPSNTSPITPSTTIAAGTSVQLTALGTFSDGTTEDLTNQAAWQSSSASVAIVSSAADSRGLVKGIGVGSATITASFAGVSGTVGITVTAATLSSIAITSASLSLAAGTTVQLAATGTFSDGSTEDLTSQAAWQSSSASVAVVSNAQDSKGLLTAVATGSASISVTFAGVSGSAPVTVTAAALSSITITPGSPLVDVGNSVPLSVTGTFSDGSTEDLTNSVSWTSSAPNIAQVSNVIGNAGLLTGIAEGTATITATQESVSGTTTATVTTPTLVSIAVMPSNPTIAPGETLQLTATGDYSDGSMHDLTSSVTWSSTSSSIASVSNTGLVSGVTTGSAEITAQGPGGLSGSTTVMVRTVQIASGSVMSGTLLIVGAQVTLYEAGTSYGGAPSAIGTATTDASGQFQLSFSCSSPTVQLYAVAVSAPTVLITAVGPCDTVPSSFVIDPVTTVGSTYALAQFFNPNVSGQVPAIGAPASNAVGFANAMTMATSNLVNISTGLAASFLSTTPNTPTSLNSLANILAACVKTNDPSSAACSGLFAATTIPGSPQPADTMQAILNEVLTPANQVSALFNLQASISPLPYTPALSAAPSDWTLGVTFNPPGANFRNPSSIAIDAAGNIWAGNRGASTVTELSPSGALIGNFNPSGANIKVPRSMAIDPSGNVWVTNGGNYTVTELSSSGTLVGNFKPTGANFSAPFGVAIDPSGNVWVANTNNNTVTELSSSGTLVGNFNPTGAGLVNPYTIAIDSASNVWVPNFSGNSVVKLSASGTLLGNFNPSGANFNGPRGIAFDAAGNAWVSNASGNTVTELSSNGALLGNFIPSGLNLRFAIWVAIDSGNNVWVANGQTPYSVKELNSSGALIGSFAPRGANLNINEQVAVDSSGNVWVPNLNGNSIGGLVGAARPLTTPLVACLTKTPATTACKP